MKKILSILTITTTIFSSIWACKPQKPLRTQNNINTSQQSSVKDKFLSETKKALSLYIKDKSYNPESVKINDMSIAYLDDSVCVLNFRSIGENQIGYKVNRKCQFIFLKHQGDMYQCFQTNNDDSPECFTDDNWLGEASSMLGWSLPLEVAEKDKFVKDRIYKGKDTTDLSDKYIRAYCIVMKRGERIIKHENYKPTEFID